MVTLFSLPVCNAAHVRVSFKPVSSAGPKASQAFVRKINIVLVST